jgi:hypothetical protein
LGLFKGFLNKKRPKYIYKKIKINRRCPDFLLFLPTHSNTVVGKRDFYPTTIGRNILNSAPNPFPV